MRKHEGVFAVIIAILVLSAFIIPFTLLTDVTKWYGSFLFWVIVTVCVIGINYLLIKDWGKES